jgi:CRP-like cAMP-binding protein
MDAELSEAEARHRAQPHALGPALHLAWLLERAGADARPTLRAYAGQFGVDAVAGDALHALVRQVPATDVASGAPIVSEGEASDALYVVVRGRVEVRRRGAGVLARLGAGQSFGEVALLARTPRTATVLADGPVSVLAVQRAMVQQLARYFPPLVAILQAIYRDRMLAQLVTPGSAFATLDAAQRHALFARFVPGAAPAGAVVLREGQEGVGFFVIVSGRAEVTRVTLQRRIERVASLGPGDFFGEISLLYEMPVTATVQAAEPLTWLLLEREQFHEVMRAHPEQIARVQAVARQRLGYEAAGPVVDVARAGMTCPRCGYDQDEGLTCVACGANIARERRILPVAMPSL